ncbi:serine/threonine protein kinase AKL1 Ecym_2650 [Eremothecium cymbalariae DBVPG|uniref:Protein kinase domain-containing protein n=1 Tax=Eremothecium cymbalariae (strain CBS 270.75 / DBVPG 7215 / KCTC 17166 / NRRL Y-17582) TaxID=931890 RepID=G8JNT6_ERECY|nr:Hypothetical protein Ecym_2650 [Eremothecium cymbalariae DBVPG\
MSKSSSEHATRTDNSSGLVVGPRVLEKLTAGSILLVGVHRVEIIEYLAEGGFAHIYKVSFIEYTNELDRHHSVLQRGDIACLKRVQVNDENGLNELRNEVEVMKKLKGCGNVVQYYDSNASRHTDGTPGFEVLLLMELCSNGSLLDYMNQRLATKLSEREVLKIMYDITKGISHMHFLRTPLIHRDIKIENVLVDSANNFKLCDFGSTSTCLPAVSTHQEIAMLTNNIYVHTTPQYRSPEMIDLYRCLAINEKSDIWALGIFLYKLLFYTTPFELTGQFAILHSKYDIPQNNFSSKLINLIIVMLAENPYIRPNIYQILYHICSIMECDVPIEDHYGQGPYDFNKYARYQERLQRLQYEILVNQQNAYRGGSYIDKLNNQFVENFEVAPRQPISMAQGPLPSIHGHVNTAPTVSSAPVLQQFPLNQGTSETNSSDILKGRIDEYKDSNQRSWPISGDGTPFMGSAKAGNLEHPMVHMQVAKQEVPTQHTDHSDLSESLCTPSDISTPATGTGAPFPMEPSNNVPKTTKQYKSNNPFPKMAKQEFVPEMFQNEKDESFIRKDPSSVSISQRADSLKSIAPIAVPNLPAVATQQNQQKLSHATQPRQLSSEPQHIQRSAYPIYYNGQSAVLPYPYYGENSLQPSQIILGQQQQQQNEQPSQKLQQTQQQIKPINTQNSQNIQSQNQHTITPLSRITTEVIKDKELVPFESPEKPKDHQLDLTYNQVNLSHNSQDSSPREHDDGSLASDEPASSVLTSESIIIELSQKDDPTSNGSNEIARSVKKNDVNIQSKHIYPKKDEQISTRPVRRSLELDFQEIDLSASPSPGPISKVTSKLPPSNPTSSSVGMNSNCSTGVRKSFQRPKKSLDMDSVKKDSKDESSSAPSKRRSLFGVFKT